MGEETAETGKRQGQWGKHMEMKMSEVVLRVQEVIIVKLDLDTEVAACQTQCNDVARRRISCMRIFNSQA